MSAIRISAVIFVMSLASMMSSCVSPRIAADDLALQQRLQHTWSYRHSNPQFSLEGETTYLPGGVMNLFGRFRYGGQTRAIAGNGTWHVKNGYLYSTLTRSNASDILPNGFTSSDKILRVTDREFRYLSSATGKIVIERRVR